MRNYKERISYIGVVCDMYKIPYEIIPCWEGWQIKFPWCVGDVACHNYTYGRENGCVESYKFPWDKGDVSVLTPEDAANRIVDYYKDLGLFNTVQKQTVFSI